MPRGPITDERRAGAWSDEELKLSLAASEFKYFYHVAEHFALPGGDERLLAHVPEQHSLPKVGTAGR